MRAPDSYYLPDFCAGRSVAVVAVVCQLLAFVLAMTRPASAEDAGIALLKVSLFLHWLGLMSALALCAARPLLARLGSGALSATAFAIVVATTALLSVAAWHALRWAGYGHELGTADRVAFVLRNAAVSAIIGAVLLRYLFVQHRWRREVEREADSRIQALAARIRPHFLFNSMNTIAALVRSQPAEAERAIEDLADLFRASLADARTRVPLAEELELARLYARLEHLRLGERLVVDWEVPAPLPEASVPRLALQPLVENAIRHGIEPRPGGGRVTVRVREAGGDLELEVTNPLPPADAGGHDGNRMALDNIRERIALAYGERALLEAVEHDGAFRALLRLPREAPP
jgi:two-component system sensor histidine kinase AlgZ